MGSASSSLSPEQIVSITAELRQKLEKCKADNISDEDTISQLESAYNYQLELFKKLSRDKSQETFPVAIRSTNSAKFVRTNTNSNSNSNNERNSYGNSNNNSNNNSNANANSNSSNSNSDGKTDSTSTRIKGRRSSFDDKKDTSNRRRSFSKQSNDAVVVSTNRNNKVTDSIRRPRSFDGEEKNTITVTKKDNVIHSNSQSTANINANTITTNSNSNNNDGDNNNLKSTDNITTENTLNSSNPSLIFPTESKDVADSWDSVAQQPFCRICKMAFKSAAFLERHVKFSDLHAKSLQREKEAASGINKDIDPATLIKIANQKEGEHYMLMYSGSKLFWRTQITVDLNMYYHVLPHAIEVIAFDSNKHREMNRLYFDINTLDEIVETMNKDHSMSSKGTKSTKNLVTSPTLAHEIDKMMSASSSVKAGLIMSPREIQEQRLGAESRMTEIISFIMERLQLTKSTKQQTDKADGVSLGFLKLSADTYKRSPLLESCPIVCVPVKVARRRKTNSEEIDATITSLTHDRAALAAATGKAEKIANLVYAGASAIGGKKWWSHFNSVRRKWIWAIRRVIRQKLVAETKAVLTKKAEAIEATLHDRRKSFEEKQSTLSG